MLTSNRRTAARAHHGTPTHLLYRASANKFSDLTPEQFKASYLMSDSMSLANMDPDADDMDAEDMDAEAGSNITTSRRALTEVPPTDVDWVAAGKVTPIRDQGACGEFSLLLVPQSQSPSPDFAPHSPPHAHPCTSQQAAAGRLLPRQPLSPCT